MRDHETGHTSDVRPADQATRALLQRVVALPPLPRQSVQLLQLLADPDLDILHLVTLIEETPALAARLLGVANSAYFSNGAPARSVADAIIRLLGLDLTRDLAVSLVLNQPFRLAACPPFEPLRYWQQAFRAASFAQALAPAGTTAGAATPAEAYLAGLLHNLGVLALVQVAPAAMAQVFERAAHEPDLALAEIARQALGMDHAAAGGALAAAWHLPPRLVRAIAHHRNPTYRAEDWPLVVLTAVADVVAKHDDDTAPPDCRAQLPGVLEDLGIGSAAWHGVLGRWPELAGQVARLTAAFAAAR